MMAQKLQFCFAGSAPGSKRVARPGHRATFAFNVSIDGVR
jgi:hypothetical protein